MKILITAGPTREPIDAVRFISNRSSGRLGLALAEAATTANYTTTLLLAEAVTLPIAQTVGYRTMRFDTCDELREMLLAQWPEHDVLVMAAAVADYRPTPELNTAGKVERNSSKPLTIQLEPTPDLVAEAVRVKRPDQRVIGFALEEPTQLETRAREKLAKKGVDAIVANPLKTMDSNTIEPLWLTPHRGRPSGFESPGKMSKNEFASWLVRRLPGLMSQ